MEKSTKKKRVNYRKLLVMLVVFAMTTSIIVPIGSFASDPSGAPGDVAAQGPEASPVEETPAESGEFAEFPSEDAEAPVEQEFPAEEAEGPVDETPVEDAPPLEEETEDDDVVALATDVTDWESLRQAITAANSGLILDNTIRLANPITRAGVTTVANDLPIITNPNLVIDGGGNTLSFGSTTIDRAGFTLQQSGSGTFTLKNIVINRTATIFPLISAANGTAASSTTGYAHDARNAYGANWTVNISNLSTSGTPTSGLLSLSDGAVNFTGTISWPQTASYFAVNARAVRFDGATADIRSGTTTVRLYPSTNTAATTSVLSATNHADINLYSTADQAVYMNLEGTSIRADVLMTDSSKIYAYGDGGGTGAIGATVSIVGSGGEINLSGGAQLIIESRKAGTGTSGGQPALIAQVANGTFNVDGENTRLQVSSRSSGNSLGATIRFRLVGGQTFNVTNGGVIHVEHWQPAASAYSPAAIRFGTGTGNHFNVNSGGRVTITNHGDGTVRAGSGDGYNKAIEYDASNWGFALTGEKSTVELVADYGPVISTSSTNGSISVGPGSIFVATGITPAASDGIFRTGSNFTFTSNAPLYYDFTNRRAGGGLVFDVTSSGSAFTSTNSDVAIWRMGMNINGDPYRSWSNVTYQLSGTDFQTFVSGSPATEINAANFGTGATTGMPANTRINGNNAKPEMSDLLPATNADQYMRSMGGVREGLYSELRPIWSGEGHGVFRVWPVDNPTVPYDTTYPAYVTESVNPDSYYGSPRNGVVRLNVSPGFLRAGDKYQLISAWRGEVDPADTGNHFADASQITTDQVTVTDKVPPIPGVITVPNPSAFYANRTHAEGTFSLGEYKYQGGANNNQDYPVKIYAAVNGVIIRADTVITNGVIVTAGTGSPVLGTIEPPASSTKRWTYDIPDAVTLAPLGGDVVQFILEDGLGNANPLTDTVYHDAALPRAATVTTLGLSYRIDADDNIYMGRLDAEALRTSANLNLALIALFHAHGHDLTMGEADAPIAVAGVAPAFASTPGRYDVTFAVQADTSFTETRSIIVLPADVIVKGATYIIGADNINPMGTLRASSITDAELITESNARSWLITEVAANPASPTPSGTIQVASRNFPPDDPEPGTVGVGLGHATFRVAEEPATQVANNINIANGHAPVLTVSNPVALTVGAPALTDANFRVGVAATDEEDGTLTGAVTYSGTVDTTTIGLYPVVYSVTDSDGYTVTRTRTYVVGPYVIGDEYILYAGNFAIGINNVSENNPAKNAQIIAKSGAHAWRYGDTIPDGVEPADEQLRVDSDGGYRKAEDEYDITLTVAAEMTLTTDIVGKVVDADVTGENDNFFVSGNNILINTTVAQTITNAQILTLANARAWTLPDFTATASAVLGAHGVTDTPGTYQVVLVAAADAAADADKAKAIITVTVSDRNAPTINAGPDVTVDLDSTFNFLTGVQYEDDEDAVADLVLDYVVTDADGATVAPGDMTSVAGGYVVTYTVTDTDGNQASDGKTVLVDDGTWRRGERYLLHAENFILELADVVAAPNTARDAQIKTESGAYALTIEGLLPVPDANVYVVSAGGYAAATGLYSIRLGVRDDEPFDDVAARLDIRAIVYEDNIDIGDDYIITSRNFTISVSQAIAKTNANLLTWGNVKVYDAHTFDDVTADSLRGPEVVSDSIPASGTPSGGTPYEAVYRAKLEHSTSVASEVTVISGNAPVLTVGTPKNIPVGSTYNPLVDVTVSDVEDGAALTVADVVINGGAGSTVITTVVGIYVDEYSVTDSDGNESTATRVVAVNDGTIDVGDKYVLWAHSFGIRKALVAVPAGRDDQIVEKTEAEAYNAETGAPATVLVTSDGGYTDTEGAYSIVLAVEGDDGSDPAGRAVTARVIDRDVVVTIGGYIIAADNFTVNTTDETGITNPTLLTRSDAVAWARDDALTPVPASGIEVATYGGGRNGTPGNYPLRVRVTTNPQTYADVVVTVTDGSGPVITLTTPVSIPVGGPFDATADVSATDAEDGNLTSAVTNNASTALNVDVIGVYPVTYRVTDSDHNEATEIRVVVVGPIHVGEDYILEINNFVTLKRDVTGTDSEILSNAGARAWLLETGELAMGALKVVDDGGYTDTVGDYNITIGASAGTDPVLAADRGDIIGRVVDGDYISRDGDYIIVASDAELRLSEVPNPITDAFLVNLNEVAAYKRSDLSSTPVAVVEHDVTDAVGTHHAKYAAAEAYALDPATTAVVRPAVNVTVGNPPTLDVTTPHEVALGSGPYDYSYGVTATDLEGTPTVTHVGDVDTDTAGVYLVTYTATDSDGNEVSKDRVVVVNDGTYTVDPDYILKAESYVIRAPQVLPNNSAQVIEKTKAAAWNSRTGASAVVSVTDFGGYAQAPGAYDVVVAVQNKLTVTRAVEALVVDAEILVETDNYYIAADAASLNSTLYDEADAADLVTYANARAWKIDRGTTAGQGLTPSPVELDSFTGTLGPESDGTYDGAAGSYLADFRVVAAPTEKVTLVPVTVNDGDGPALHFSNPLTVSTGTAFTAATVLGGVTATDTEDDLASLPLTPTANAADVALISANMDTWGVYTVELSVTDSDFNTATATRTVVVDDGTIFIGDEYILRAKYFPIEVSEVETAPGLKDAQILGRSEAQAWLLDGTPAPLAPIYVIDDGNYDDTPAVYTIQLGVTGDAALLRVIKALVYEGHITIGDNYIIVSKDYSVSVSQATAATNANLLLWGAVKVYTANTYAIQSNGAEVHDRSALVATPGGPYGVVYRVIAEQATRSTSLVTVLSGTPPVMNVSTPVEIMVGGTYDPMSNVTATDDEDGTLPASAITLNGGQPTNVNVNEAGVYTDTYTARDSDSNVSPTATRVIVVNDGTYSVGTKYILRARSYAIRKTQTQPNGTDDEIRTHSAARAWSALTGIEAPVVVFEKNGYYTDGTDTYDIQLRVGGDTGAGILGSDQGKAIRNIKAKVLDRDVVVMDDDWIIAADNIRMNSTVETGVTNEQLKTLSNVTAYQRNDALTPAVAGVQSYGGSRAGTVGVYPLVFEVTAHTATSVSVTATVTDGVDPIVTVTSPVQIPVGGPFDANAGMSATDDEDGELTGAVTNDAATSLNVNVAGVYIVTYTVEDSDFNIGTAQRVVVVNDGTIIVGPVYIVRARNFVVLKDDVTGTDNEILSNSHAYAWESATGTLRMDVLTVSSNGGYQATVGNYPISIAAGATTRAITGKVVDGDLIHTDDEYTIVASNASIRVSEVPGTITGDDLKGWNQVSAYKHSDLSAADVTVVSHNVAAAVGDYIATYAVTADTSATVAPHVRVSVGNPPELTVTTPHEVALGSGPYDYSYGVTATDIEAPPTVTHTGDVDTDTAGIYLVQYTATDSDSNQVSRSRVVVVNDGTYVVTDHYILKAESFVIRAVEALTGNQTQVLLKSKAKAWNSVTGAEVAAVVTAFGGYTGVDGTYDITVAVDLDRTVTRDIEALVVDGTYVVEGADYYIVADPVKMNTTVDLTHPNLVTLANAAAWKIDRGTTAGQGLTSATAQLESYTGSFSGAVGNYEAIFRVAEEPTTRTYGLPPDGGGVPVVVTNGVGPTLNIPGPLVIQQNGALTAAMILSGVTATDPEDNLAGIPLTGPTARASDIALIHTDTAGVYRVLVSVTDSDYNTATGYRAVVVDDGTIIVGASHILRVNNFEIEVAEVSPGSAAQILDRSHAEVWTLDGAPSGDPAEVRNDGGYTNTVFVYHPRVGVVGDTAAQRTISVLVYKDNIGIGVNYVITSVNFTIGVGEAAAATDANLISWGDVKVYSREDYTPVSGVAAAVQDRSQLQAVAGGPYPVTYRVIAEPATRDTSEVRVTDGTPPTISVTSPISHPVGTIYNPWAGVTATDFEDGPLPQASITLNGGNPSTVNANTPGIYTDAYVARDSDGNVSDTATRVVVVNDGDIYIGDEYILWAHSFGIRKVLVAATAAARTDQILEKTAARAYSVDTGAPATPVVTSDSGYTDAEGVYGISLAVAGDTGSNPAVRNVTARVLDRDVVVTHDGYIIAADNILMNTQTETGVSNVTLVTIANAEAWQQNDALTSKAAIVRSYGGHRDGTPGVYQLVFEVTEHPATSASVEATVGNRTAPVITVSSPVEVPVGGPFDAAAGASATDAEDGDLTSVLTNDAATAVNLGAAGVYTVTYRVEDSDHNVVTKPRVVVVNNGTIHIGDEYILRATNFLILKSTVTGTDAEILSKSGAMAWDLETGALKTNDLKVVSNGGYTDTVDDYAITIGASPGTDPVLANDRVDITGKVVDGGYIGSNDEYVIVGSDAHVRLSDVPGTITDATLVGWNGTVAYNRIDLSAVRVTVVDHNVSGAVGSYFVTYAVTGVTPAVAITPRVYIEVGTPPTITVSTPHEVALGSGAYDYSYDVVATDAESTPTVAHTGDVNTDVAGAYLVRYTATDSDGNVASADRVVVVNDGTYVVGADYILKAESFVVRKQEALANNQAQVLGKTKAKAWNAHTGAEVSAVVTDFDGYAAAVGDYAVTVAVDADRAVLKQVQAKVVDADILIEGGGYYIAAKSPVRMNTQTDLAQTPTGLVSLATARAWKIDRGTTAGQGMTLAAAELDSYTGLFDGTAGDFVAVFRVVDEPATTTTGVTVTVSDGSAPILSYQNPLPVPQNGTLNVLSGVTAYDAEDSPAGRPLDIVAEPADVALIDTRVPGVYTVRISVTDSDGNVANGSRTVVVDDGTYYVVPDADPAATQILHASGFGIAVANVDESSESSRNAQIISEAGAEVWDVDGVPIANPDIRVIDAGGYSKERGNYPIVLQLGNDATKQRTIYAQVTAATVRVTFNANGSPYPASPSVITVSEPRTTIGEMPWGPAWTGYTFKGWNTSPTGNGQGFDGSTPLSTDITLYAVWEKNAEVVIPPQTPPIVNVTTPSVYVEPPIVNVEAPAPTIIERVVTQVREAAATPDPEENIEETPEPTATPEPAPTLVNLGDEDIPLASAKGEWALSNLLLMLFGLETLILVYFLWRRREDPEYEEQDGKSKVWLIVLAAASFGNVLLYIFTQPAFDSTMVMTDKWTLLSAILFAATVVAGLLLNVRKNEEWDDEAYEMS